jgi:hypothetical protein
VQDLAEFIFHTWIFRDFSLQHPRTCYYDLGACGGSGSQSSKPTSKLFTNPITAPRSVFFDTDTAREAFRRGPFHGILAATDWVPSATELPWLGPAYTGKLVAHTIPNCSTHRFWYWESAFRPRRALAVDMHMVPMDAQAIFAAFNVKVDFYFTSDVADILMNAYHSDFFEFQSTRDILTRDYNKPLSADLVKHVEQARYEFIITGHTLYTTLVFAQLGLPMLHINSTRYANTFIKIPALMDFVHGGIVRLLQSGRLTIFHNNRADEAYFNWYFPWFGRLWPGRSLHVPSLCEFGPRLRVKTPPGPRRYMFWDPRNQTVVGNGSPYLAALWKALKDMLGDRIDRTHEIKGNSPHIPDGFQDKYAAIIHIPYNVSTMSMFEQARAGIPTWVPSKKLLGALWNSPTEHTELSWYAFERDKLAAAPLPERIDRPEVVAEYLERTDFDDILGCSVLRFDCAADLCGRIDVTDYDAVISQAHAEYVRKRSDIYADYRDFLRITDRGSLTTGISCGSLTADH